MNDYPRPTRFVNNVAQRVAGAGEIDRDDGIDRALEWLRDEIIAAAESRARRIADDEIAASGAEEEEE